jgi:hypothetical protein
MRQSIQLKIATALSAVILTCSISIAGSSTSTSPASVAVVVRQPGEYPLGAGTRLVVSFETLVGFPSSQLTYKFQYANPDGGTLSTDFMNTKVDVGEPIVFYFDPNKRLLWWGSSRFLATLPWHALENDRSINDDIATRMPSIWSTSGDWRKWDPHSCGISASPIPDDFWNQAQKTFRE